MRPVDDEEENAMLWLVGLAGALQSNAQLPNKPKSRAAFASLALALKADECATLTDMTSHPVCLTDFTSPLQISVRCEIKA